MKIDAIKGVLEKALGYAKTGGQITPDEYENANMYLGRIFAPPNNMLADHIRRLQAWKPAPYDWVIVPSGEVGWFVGMADESIYSNLAKAPSGVAVVHLGDARHLFPVAILKPYVAELAR